MAGAVAGLLTSGLVGIAKDKLRSAITEQASMLWNFGSDLGEMEDHLETISAVLVEAEKQSVRGELVRLWLKRLKDAAIDISDMLEDYKDMKDQANETMPGVLSCLPMAYKKIGMANKMKSMRERLSKIRNEIGGFNFTMGSSTTHEKPCNERETTSSVPEEPVIGRDREKQEIINMLSANTSNNGMVIVPIYGLGGMGKTTLAQLVYNDAQFKQYDHRVWVYVSQDFNLNKIGSSIISQLQPQGGQQNMCTQEVINQCLQSLLCGKKVLVVLDDLWEERTAKLDKLRIMLHIRDSMVDVIVTTRKEEIARKVCTSEPYKLQTLEDHKCWEIIKRYSKFEELEFDQARMGQIGLDIAQKCGGVALAAQAVGFMLRSIHNLSGWEEINNSDIWNGSSEDCDVLPSLKLSYERMPPQLRICFSYCAIFPKGHNIIEDELVQQWIALDFIEQSKGKEYIKQLLGMSFLQVSMLPSTSQEQVVRYTMHDLVHDVARLAMDDELIDSSAQERNTLGHKYCRYLLLNYDQTTMLASISPSKIRALHFSDSVELDIQSGEFSFVNCLRALGFCECSGILFPASIGHLRQLRCLIAPRMQNKSLPGCITELSKLQYLNVNGSSKITLLPESIGKLRCLKYLRLSACSGISKLPESFGDLKSMVHLDMSGCDGIRELPNSVGNLMNLQHVELSGCSSVKTLPESLCGLTQLQYLNLSSCSCLEGLPECIGGLVVIKHLYMSDCEKIKELPESLGDLKCVVHLDMSGCSGLTQLPDSLGNLTHLQHLELSGCSSVKAVPQSLCGLTQLQYLNLSSCSWLDGLPEGFGSLVGLQHLYMSDCPKISELPQSMMKLQSLSHLNLSGCSNMRTGSLTCLRGLTTLQLLDISRYYKDLSDNLGALSNTLKYLCLSGCALSCYDFIATFSNLEHLDLSNNSRLEFLPESIGNLKRLHTLNLKSCWKLKSLPESIGTLVLESLLLEGCCSDLLDQANALGYYLQTLPLVFRVRADVVNGCSNLHLLEGINASELRIISLENVRSPEEATKLRLLDKHNLSELRLEWSTERAGQFLDDQVLLGQLVPPRGLKSIQLEGYNCTRFPSWLMWIYSHLPNLVSIWLIDMPTCSNLPPLGQLPHLEKLELLRLPSIKTIDREFCGGRGAFPRLSSLCIFDMEGLEKWITTYSVEDGVEEFMFPMLDDLKILFCPRLRLKSCPPTFRECTIFDSDKVISSLEEAVDRISQMSLSPSRAIKLHLYDVESYQSIRIFHHFPALQELTIQGYKLTSLPESMRHLTSLESLNLGGCNSISSLPKLLGDLFSLKSLDIDGCHGIISLPACIQQLTKLQKLQIRNNQKLKKWCESEQNKTKLAHINNIKFIED